MLTRTNRRILRAKGKPAQLKDLMGALNRMNPNVTLKVFLMKVEQTKLNNN